VTPTFFSGVFHIDNWRWAGVPFYVRTGKRLPRRASEITVQFKQPPLQLFERECGTLKPNALVLSIQPQEEIALQISVKESGISNQPYTVTMGFNYAERFGIKQHPAYERLMVDFLRGDLTLFARQEGVEAMWSIVDPIIRRYENNPPADFPNYAAGTWGPKAADELIARDGRSWYTPS
jgi:glucose-6-phosphate 1-dehydrogenase